MENTLRAIRLESSNIMFFLAIINFVLLFMVAIIQMYYIGKLEYETHLLFAHIRIIGMIINVWIILFLFNIAVGVTKDIREILSKKKK